ncbi:major facilitator superfamily domain-containing protein [Paraphysoderma sedebokerense]|nr:major facilitator superfamily domain-containing protein [Paraphysoderma sedebokerense]
MTGNGRTYSTFQSSEEPEGDEQPPDPLKVPSFGKAESQSPHLQSLSRKPSNDTRKDYMRWISLFLSCMLLFGNYYAYDNPAALSLALQRHLELPYSVYQTYHSLFYSLYSFPNIILPLISGYLISKFGTAKILLILSSCVCLGQFLFCLGVWLQDVTWMLIGRVVFGIGGESVGVAQASITAAWFRQKEMAFALGINLCISRFGSVLNSILSPSIETATNVTVAVSVGWIMCILSFISAIVLVFVVGVEPPDNENIDDSLSANLLNHEGCEFCHDEHLSAEDIESYFDYKNVDGQDESQPLLIKRRKKLESRSPSPSNHSNIFRILPAEFYILCVICVLLYGTIVPFNTIMSDFLQTKWFNGDATKAGWVMSIPDTISAILVPPLGIIIDHYGHKISFLSVCSLAISLSHVLLAITYIPPQFPLVVLGISYSIYGTTLWPSIAGVLDTDGNEWVLGTGYGIATSVMNGGLFVVPVIVAQIIVWTNKFLGIDHGTVGSPGPDSSDASLQFGDYFGSASEHASSLSDILAPQKPLDPSMRFLYVELFFALLSFLGAVFCLFLWLADKRHGCRLQLPEVTSMTIVHEHQSSSPSSDSTTYNNFSPDTSKSISPKNGQQGLFDEDSHEGVVIPRSPLSSPDRNNCRNSSELDIESQTNRSDYSSSTPTNTISHDAGSTQPTSRNLSRASSLKSLEKSSMYTPPIETLERTPSFVSITMPRMNSMTSAESIPNFKNNWNERTVRVLSRIPLTRSRSASIHSFNKSRSNSFSQLSRTGSRCGTPLSLGTPKSLGSPILSRPSDVGSRRSFSRSGSQCECYFRRTLSLGAESQNDPRANLKRMPSYNNIGLGIGLGESSSSLTHPTSRTNISAQDTSNETEFESTENNKDKGKERSSNPINKHLSRERSDRSLLKGVLRRQSFRTLRNEESKSSFDYNDTSKSASDKSDVSDTIKEHRAKKDGNEEGEQPRGRRMNTGRLGHRCSRDYGRSRNGSHDGQVDVRQSISGSSRLLSDRVLVEVEGENTDDEVEESIEFGKGRSKSCQ